jgi:hypothetical protein
MKAVSELGSAPNGRTRAWQSPRPRRRAARLVMLWRRLTRAISRNPANGVRQTPSGLRSHRMPIRLMLQQPPRGTFARRGVAAQDLGLSKSLGPHRSEKVSCGCYAIRRGGLGPEAQPIRGSKFHLWNSVGLHERAIEPGLREACLPFREPDDTHLGHHQVHGLDGGQGQRAFSSRSSACPWPCAA